MAGKVKTTVWVGHSGVLSISPNLCPAHQEGIADPPCLVADPRRSGLNLCPFAYRFLVRPGGQEYEVMTVDAMLQWLAAQELHQADWTTLCLRKESAGTEIGARLRSG